MFRFFGTIVGLCLALVLPASRTIGGEADLEFFEAKIRPVLVEHCYECHAAEADSVRGGLLVDSSEALRTGGDSGPAVVPGNPDESLLLSALKYDSFEMPPSGKLSDEVIQDFERWIAAGATDPRSASAAPTRLSPADKLAPADHWAFQTPQLPAVPDEVADPWVRNSIDGFVLRRLVEQGWRPADEANKYTLIRRLSFDLLGLPPSQAEIERFVADQRPDAYERLVEEMLALPAYGERWGRHWLDCVRYADSNGADENHGLPNAWRFRDWVVRAFNRDLSYDAMLMQQIAGDLLPVPDDEHQAGELLAATGMLVIGPKMLAEQDKEKMVADIVDEQIDTVTRTFLGLTINCARCHDHKFDPVTAADYYALAGIFTSTKTMADRAFVSNWMERPLPSQEIELAQQAHAVKVDEAKKQRDEFVTMATSQLMATGQFEKQPEKPEDHFSEEQKAKLAELNKAVETLEQAAPKFDMVMAVTEAEPVDVPVHIRGNHLRHADEPTPRGAPQCLQLEVPLDPIPNDASGRLELAQWLTDRNHPLTARVIVNRVWGWHFGEGLVRSPSNFGYMGEQPTHPELLDYLAVQLMEHDWSLKWLHREIVTSAVYRMSSYSTAYDDHDPDNRLLWKRNRRRLEVEPLRDAILATGGSLDRQFEGAAVAEAANRRTVYLSINRAALNDLFSTFDYVDPASHIEQRPVTTVPNQALFLLNHPVVFQQAKALAKTVIADFQDPGQRVHTIWMNVYGRPPSEQEITLALTFLDQVLKEIDQNLNENDRQMECWTALVRSLIAGNEFIWID